MSFVFSMTYPESLVLAALALALLLALNGRWGAGALTRRRIVRLPVLVVSAALLVAGTMTIPLANP